MELNDLEVNEYQLYGGDFREEDVRLQRRRQPGGPSLWAIMRGGFCLDKEGDWRIEMLPSSRTPDFINVCRWESPEEALAFWEQYAAKYAVTIEADDGKTYALLDWERIHSDMGV